MGWGRGGQGEPRAGLPARISPAGAGPVGGSPGAWNLAREGRGAAEVHGPDVCLRGENLNWLMGGLVSR
jgi:hypothetical protein